MTPSSYTATPAIELRPYQREAIEAFEARTAGGLRRGIVNLPTGCGKTILGLALARQRGGRTLWLAHRDELIEQPLRALRAVWPDAPAGVVKADRDEVDAQVVFGSIQTVSRPARLERLVRAGAFDLLVVDEAHHAVAPSYVATLQATGAFDPVGPPTLGLTATIERGDRVGLDAVFEDIVYQLQLLQAIRDGWLVDLRVQRVVLDVDFDAIPVTHGDFAAQALDAALLRAGVAEATAEAYIEHATGRKALIFTVSVDQARRTAQALQRRGVAAEWVSGETPIEERRAILERLRTGETVAVANCAVLTEGFDEPSVSAILVARPTRSKALYLQMIGRGTRKHPAKEDCLIVDFVGAAAHHTLVQAATLFGLAPSELEGRTVTEAIEARERTGRGEERMLLSLVRASAGARKVRIRWVEAGRGLYAASAGDQGLVLLVERAGGWVVRVVPRDRGAEPLTLQPLPVDLELAQGIAEDYLRRVDAVRLAREDAAWRSRPASERQLAALQRWGVPVTRPLTAGEAADLLTAAAARARVRRRPAWVP